MSPKLTNTQTNQDTISWEQYRKAVHLLARKIPIARFSAIYGVPRGGLVLATYLSHLLDLPLFLHDFRGKTRDFLLICDDVSDTGVTLAKLTGELRRKGVRFEVATLHRKDGTIYEPKYCVKTINNWIVYPYEEKLDDKRS